MTRLASNARLVNDWLEYARREQGRAADTIYKYGLSMRSFLVHLDKKSLAEATADDLRAWIHQPNQKTGGDVSPATVKRKTCELRSLYGYLADVACVVPTNTARRIHVPTVHNEEPKPAPEEAWIELWRSDLSLSDRVAFGLGYFCGLRRHEVTLLAPWHFVEVPKQRIGNFKRKGGKKMSLPYASCAHFYAQRRPDLIGGSAETFLGPLSELLGERRKADATKLLTWREELGPAVRQVHPMPDDYITPGQFNKHLRKALRRADVPELLFSPHQLRHSFGTNMVSMGKSLLEVSRLMGHSSVAVTQRYVDLFEDPFEADLRVDDGEAVSVSSPWG